MKVYASAAPKTPPAAPALRRVRHQAPIASPASAHGTRLSADPTSTTRAPRKPSTTPVAPAVTSRTRIGFRSCRITRVCLGYRGMGRERVKGHLDLLVLAVLQRGAAHGYEVIAQLRRRSEGDFDLP